MKILVCLKRVPTTGARILLTADEQEIDTRNLGFAMSPHEECAVEAGVQLIEQHGGSLTVLTLGPEEAVEQLRYALAMGADDAILLAASGDVDPMATAGAITAAIRERGGGENPFDLLLFGNEAADSGGYQVGIRVAHALGLPCVTGVKRLDVTADGLEVRREAGTGWEVYRVPLPAVITIREGINLPRYPSVPGRLRAKKKPVETVEPHLVGGGPEKIRLVNPPEQDHAVQILGQGPAAVPRIVELLQELRLL